MDEPVVDCHVHVFDPRRLPVRARHLLRPRGRVGTVAQLVRTHDAHGVRHALLVGPELGVRRGQQLSARRPRDRRRSLPGCGRGARTTCRAPGSRSSGAAGVVGVTLNAALLGVPYYDVAATLLSVLADLDMWADVQVTGDQLPALSPLLANSGVRVVVDHCGRPDPGKGLAAPGFRELLALGRQGRAVVKLSGLVKFSGRPPPARGRLALPARPAGGLRAGPLRLGIGLAVPPRAGTDRLRTASGAGRGTGARPPGPTAHPLGHPAPGVSASRGDPSGGWPSAGDVVRQP